MCSAVEVRVRLLCMMHMKAGMKGRKAGCVRRGERLDTARHDGERQRGEGRNCSPRPSVEGENVGGEGGWHASLPACRFQKYHMTAPMCCRLLQVNYRPQNRPGKKKGVCNF